MSKRGRTVFITVVILAAVGVVAGVAIRSQGPGQLERVSAAEVSFAEMTETISGTGSFVPASRSTVYAKLSGNIQDILVEEGQYVEVGEVLLQIDDDDYVQSLEKARISYQTARRNALQQVVSLQNSFKTARRSLAQAQRNHDNNVELREADAISQEQFQQSLESLEAARDALQSARERLNLYMGRSMTDEPILNSERAEELVDEIPSVRQAALSVNDAEDAVANTRPTAKEAGTVARIAVEEGANVAPNAPLVRIERLEDMNAEVQIDEVDIGKISEGDTAEISSDSMLGETITGTVTNISPVIQQVGNTRVSSVEIELDTNGRTLKSGASCTARISTTTKENALVLPITAYETEDEEAYTFVLQPVESTGDGAEDTPRRFRLARRAIRLGIVTVDQVEVLDGLEEGDLVATGNFERLREDMMVARSPE